MTQYRDGPAAVLAVRVGPAATGRRSGPPSTSGRDEQLLQVRDLVAIAGGQEVGSPGDVASFYFEAWRQAIDAAIALTTAGSNLATHQAGVGLDLAGSRDARDALERAAAVAREAPPNEIRLGDGLAAVALVDPPDRRVVKRDGGHSRADSAVIYRLAIAKDEVPNNLPEQMTSFVGRATELRDVGDLLAQARLLTVTGPPGAGKTRLACELAERFLGRFRDGAWFVALAPIADPRLMLSTLADTVGLLPPADRSVVEALGTHLRGRRSLVILDNFEHITAAAADLAALLAAAPTLRVLATSRAPLHLSGEYEYPLPPLDVPGASGSTDDVARSEAGDLFARRAIASQPTFGINDQNAWQVGELCRRLDGLPLAIELAAARVKILPLAGIVARLDHRLSLLSGGSRDRPVRHQSLRAAVAWSYELLEPTTQRLFRRLSVFRGGWTIESAAAVCSAEGSDPEMAFDALVSLVDGSLVVRPPSDAAAERFMMLETLREFAAERLDEAGETADAQARHARYCLELVEATAPRFTGPDRAVALDIVAVEHDNMRAALDHLLEADAGAALRLGAGLWRFWQMRGHLVEGSRWLDRALDAAGPSVRDTVRARALEAAGGIAYWRGEMAEAQRYYEAALAARRRIGDEVGIAGALYDLGFTFYPGFFPRPADARRSATGMTILEEAETLYRRAGDEAGMARTGWAIGSFLMFSDPVRSRELLSVSVERFRRLSDPFGLGWALRIYGQSLLAAGDPVAAAEAAREALQLFAAADDGSALGLLLDDFAAIAQVEGDLLRASRLRGAAAGLRQLTEAEIANENQEGTDAPDATRGVTDPAALERAWAEGQAMTQTEAIGYALASDAVAPPDGRLLVTTLGRFVVERASAPLTRWGGPKAGSRQAQAMFAFLLDRADRGVTKDEFIDVIWPDADVSQADLNFHRTLGGLRGTLEPDRTAVGTVITFRNGRYRLDGSIVGWLDAEEFEQRSMNASLATDDLSAIRGLEAARAMYRGDYLDDCPFYGDSEYVEGRRGVLRGHLIDTLVDLGARYEARAESTLAAARFREAVTISGGTCRSAEEGLRRLGVSA